MPRVRLGTDNSFDCKSWGGIRDAPAFPADAGWIDGRALWKLWENQCSRGPIQPVDRGSTVVKPRPTATDRDGKDHVGARKKAVTDTQHETTPSGSIEIRHHATELSLHLRGHSAEDLFRLAAFGLARVQMPQRPEKTTVEDVVELVSDDWEDHLVNWLNHLIYLSEKHIAVWTQVEFELLDASKLKATVRGVRLPETPDSLDYDIRSASYQGIEFIPGPSLWLAHVTLEI